MLPDAFLDRPIAHRGLHDTRAGRPENSYEAIEAAVEHGFGIEIDIQMTADRQALVFHDYDLSRLTIANGKVRDRTARDLETIPLRGTRKGPPLLKDALDLVDGRVPLLIELKDQTGILGDNVGELEAAVASVLVDYDGPVAVMSFNPFAVAAFQALLPEIPRGLVTEDFLRADYALPEERLDSLNSFACYERAGACFISHNHRDLSMPQVTKLKEDGAKILCWTIRSLEEAAEACQIAENITFEGFLPKAAPLNLPPIGAG